MRKHTEDDYVCRAGDADGPGSGKSAGVSRITVSGIDGERCGWSGGWLIVRLQNTAGEIMCLNF